MGNKIKLLMLLIVMVCMVGGCGQEDISNQEKVSSQEVESTSNVEDIQKDVATENSSDKKEQETTRIDKPEMKGTITVSSFFENEYLNAAAKQFMKKYPDVEVIINEYGEDIVNPSEKDYQTLFNTKLMGGEAEDIVLNSFLPVAKYSEMGAFEDLSKYISQTPEMNDENYFMNVIKAAEQENGNIYLLPYMARFDILDFDGALLEEQENAKKTIKDKECIRFSEGTVLAEQLVKNTNRENAFLTMVSQVQCATRLIKDRLGEFVDIEKKEVHIDTAEYINLLNTVKEYEDAGYFVPEDMDFYNSQCFVAESLDWDFQAAFWVVDQQSDSSYCMPIADKEGNVMLNANFCLMLNSSSGHKELAWEFIKYLLSEEVQSLPSAAAVPVNRKGFEKAVKRQYDFYYQSNQGGGSLEDYRNTMVEWMEQINACDTLDTSLINLMEEENEKYFKGKQTDQETAKRLQGKLEQYFNE